MNEQFIASFPYLEEKELPGFETWNALLKFIRGIKSESPFITLDNRQPEGCSIKLDAEGILELLRGTVLTFQASLGFDEGDNRGKDTPYLQISGGTVRVSGLSFTVTDYRERVKEDEPTRAWLRITKAGAEIHIGGAEFPKFVDDENGRINWPLAIVEKTEEDQGTSEKGVQNPLSPTPYSITVLHQGDVNIVAVPPSWIDGYSIEGQKARIIDGGKEVYMDIGDCDEEEQEDALDDGQEEDADPGEEPLNV